MNESLDQDGDFLEIEDELMVVEGDAPTGVIVEPYNPNEDREKIRGRLAQALVILLLLWF